ACDVEAGVAERGALVEGAGGLAVDPVLPAFGDRGDALPDEGTAGGAGDPDDHSVGAGLPLEAVDPLGRVERLGGGRRSGGGAVSAEGFDPRDEVANLRFALRHLRVADGLLFGGRRGDRPGEGEVGGPEAGQRNLHFGCEVAAVAEQASRDRAEAWEEIEPLCRAEADGGEERRGDADMIVAEEADQARRDSSAGERLGRLAADG